MAYFLTTKKLHDAIISVGLFLLSFSSIYGVNSNTQKILTTEFTENETDALDLTNWIRLGDSIIVYTDQGRPIEIRYYRDKYKNRVARVCKEEDTSFFIGNNWIENITIKKEDLPS